MDGKQRYIEIIKAKMNYYIIMNNINNKLINKLNNNNNILQDIKKY